MATLVAVAVLVSATFPSPSVARKTRRTDLVQRIGRIAPGVVHRVIRQRGVPRVIHVVVADVGGAAHLTAALSNGVLPGLERTSSIARRHRAVAAINGDFFRPSGRPVAAFATGGDLMQTPLTWGANLAFSRGGRLAVMGHPQVKVRLVGVDSNARLPVARVNEGRPRRAQVKLYTRQGGRLIRPPRNSCSARLVRESGNRFVPGGEVVARYKVGRIRCGRARMSRRGGVVVAARRWGKASEAIKALRHQRAQQLIWSLGWPHVGETIGGNPVLIKDGELAWDNLRGRHPIFNAHPRTGVGIRADGKILLVTVDGRRPRYSRGMTLLGFARLMRSLGARWALNLDGGGSTTMVVKGKVMNRPSDGRERSVGSALMLVMKRGGSGVRSVSPFTDDEQDEIVVPAPNGITSTAPASPAETDPASIGGLASWMRSEQESMPRGLTSLARRFDWLRAGQGLER